MGPPLQVVYLARHGETAWSLSGQHTGLTDLPLTDNGKHNAVLLGQRLKGLTFAKVFTSPLQRASLTCQLASATSPRSIPTWWSGITASTRVLLLKRFSPNAPAGSFSTMAVREANRQSRLGRARTVSSAARGRSTATFCFFPAAIFCVCSARAGSGCRRSAASTSS
jgi:Histidine phosphatase superfamily (branch 1)